LGEHTLDIKVSLRQALSLEHRRINILEIGMALLGLAALFGAILTLIGRTGGDQEAFMYAASRLLAGARPGMDLWEVKPPVNVYFLALGQWLFGGPSYLCTLTVDMVLQFAGALVLALGLARRFGRRIGILVALLYLADYYVLTRYWTRAQVEATANALMMAALGLLFADSIHLWFLAGVLFATAGATKGLTFLFIVPFGVLLLSLDHSSRSRKILVFSAGVCVGLMAWFALWAINGSLIGVLKDIRDITVFQNSGNINIRRALVSSLGYVLTSGMWPVLLGMALLPFVDWRLALRKSSLSILFSGLFLVSWGVVSLSVVAIQGLYFAYHYLHFILGGALFAGLTVFLVVHYQSRITWKRSILAVGLLAMLVGTAIAVPDFRDEFRRSVLLGDTAHQVYWLMNVVTGRMSREEYFQRLSLSMTYDENELIKTAEAVRHYSSPGDKVLYLDTGKIAWRADRVSASRYFIPLPVQRVLSGQSSKATGTQAYKDLYDVIWNYSGPVIVLEEGWFQLKNDPVLQERIFNRFKVAEFNPSPTPFGGHYVLVPQASQVEHSGDQ
jgi:MFS family permease